MSSDVAQPDNPGSGAPGAESLACVSCRARKLKCDRVKPACGRCARVLNECVYPEARRKPAFKRRNVKELEARLAQVEDYLKEVNKTTEDKNENGGAQLRDEADVQFTDFNFGGNLSSTNSNNNSGNSSDTPQVPPNVPQFHWGQESAENDQNASQLVGLGTTESLPPLEVMEELNAIFFQKQYHYLPILHPGRYLQAFYSGPLRKPPMCLQYAVWALAAFGDDKYNEYQHIFYRRARQYAESDEMKGHGEHFITLAHAQAWALLASWEAKNMFFTRAAISSAKCARLAHMMGLDRLDGDPEELPPTLSPALTWAELEERRRVFWGAFAIDSHGSISTGWPNLINSEDIATRLPAPEAAFTADKEEKAPFLEEAFRGGLYTGFAATIVTCEIFKIILRHIHRLKPTDHPEDIMNGPYWTRHRELDNKLSSFFMFLPEKLRLPQNARDPVAIHMNLNLHASIICLHHAAIEKVDKHNLSSSVKQTSIFRLKAAAEEIANIIKLTSHFSAASFKSPLFALSLYCAITVYIYMAKQNPETGLNPMDISNFEMIVHAMEAIGRSHNITRAFLQQACLDIERNNLESSICMPNLGKYREAFGNSSSNIPLLARSSVARHTEVSPVLPGRLPLGNPKGSIPPRQIDIRMDPRRQMIVGSGGVVRELFSQDCFQPVLGAVTRNIAPQAQPHEQGNKRKRMSTSKVPDRATEQGNLTAGLSSLSRSSPENLVKPGFFGGGMWQTGRVDSSQAPIQGHALPDRANSSSSSSPANQGMSTETVSPSSNTSPGMGLGNTAEENRIDLRPFQGRISTPIWESTEEAVMAQFTEALVNGSLANDPWSTLTADLNWDLTTPTGQ